MLSQLWHRARLVIDLFNTGVRTCARGTMDALDLLRIAPPSMLRTKARRSRPRVHRFIPFLESVEARVVPTVWTWTGAGPDQLWSDANNWRNGDGNPGVPVDGDWVSFTGSNLAYNQPSTDDIGLSLSSMLIDSAYTQVISLQANLTVSYTSQSGGTIAGAGMFTVNVNGSFLWTGGSWSDGGPNAPATTVVMNGALVSLFNGSHSDAGRTILNNGTIDLASGGFQGAQTTLNLTNSAVLQNQPKGYIVSEPDTIAYIVSLDSTGSVLNSGTILTANQLNVQLTATNAGGWLTAQGANNELVFSGDTTLNGGVANGGGLVVLNSWLNEALNGTFSVIGGTFDVEGGVLWDAGTLQADPTAGGNPTLLFDTCTVDGIGSASIAALPVATFATFEGNVLFNNIAFTNSGIATVAPGANLELRTNSTVTNTFRFNLDGGGWWAPAISGDNTGSFINNSVFILGGGANGSIACIFNNKPTGEVDLLAGTLNFAWDWTNTSGTVVFNGGGLLVNGVFTNNGTLTATQAGAITASQLVNNSTLDLTNAIMTVTGSFVQGSDGNLIIGLTGDSVCNNLLISGNATLGGALTVVLVGGYLPTDHGLPWTLMDFGSNQGNTRFGAGLVSVPDGFTDPNYGPNGVAILS